MSKKHAMDVIDSIMNEDGYESEDDEQPLAIHVSDRMVGQPPCTKVAVPEVRRGDPMVIDSGSEFAPSEDSDEDRYFCTKGYSFS